MSFKKYVEAADLAESWFGRKASELFGKKEVPPSKNKLSSIPDLDVIHKSVDMAKSISPEDRKDIERMNRRLEPGNLYKALQAYNGLIEKTGQHYPDEVIRRVSQSQRANDLWDKEYREMFLRMKDTPALGRMMLEKAFKEMGLPPTQSIKKPYEVVPDPLPTPNFDEIVDFIKLILSSEKMMNKDEIKRKVKERFPALDKADSRIGKALKKATTSSMKLYEPPKEEIVRKPSRKNHILKFPGKE